MHYSHISEDSIIFPKVNGVDIRHVHASTAMAYGRILLDILFTRQDLQGSVIIPTPRSNAPALDSKKSRFND